MSIKHFNVFIYHKYVNIIIGNNRYRYIFTMSLVVIVVKQSLTKITIMSTV